MKTKKNFLLLLAILLIFPFISAESYGSGSYGSGDFGVGEIITASSGSSGGSSSGGGAIGGDCTQNSDCEANQYCSENKCYEAECFDDSVCNTNEGETCWNYRCVKLFDMEILDFDSPVNVGEFFNFSYFVKAVAEINGDVEVKFWIENETGHIFTSGQDTFYMGSYEEKTKTKKLFLPEDISTGTYTFYIEVTYGDYTASAHRTIGIKVNKESIARIRFIHDFSRYAIYILIALGIFIICLIFYIERRKIKRGFIRDGRWIKKHKVSILTFILLIILAIVIYYFKWYNNIADWAKEFIDWIRKLFG